MMAYPETKVEAQQHVTGQVITPADTDYEQIRRGWNLALDQYPALILVAATAQDVVTGVRFANQQGLGIAIRATGHGVQYPADDNLLIVTSRLTGVEVDVKNRTVRVEAGAKWQQVLAQVTPHGLAPLLGSSPYVGVTGYTLGGGIGWLARKYGLAADSVRRIEVVTADGVLRQASATENSDLFWGLRGGGGNFGVVTALEFGLYPVPTIYGGNLIYSGENALDGLRFYRDWVKTAPDELTSSIAIIKFPNAPQLPEALRGKIQVILRAAYTGSAADGQAYIQKWVDWREPLTNTFHEMPFAEIGTISNDPVDPAAGYGSNEMFNELSDAAIATIVRRATDPASPLVMAELRHAGGAIARVAADANAIGNRDASFYFQIGGPLFTPEAKTASIAYIRQFKADLKPYLRGGVYLNFMSGDEVTSRTQDAYRPESYQRLRALKAKYDPDNRFRYSYQLVTSA
ncbi:MAG TPA: FAD-binding oxidoreductase [Phototrophicaceae bacterium]|nr:FAD-binding oxidoreductase [Phototrophicaceae bacterium]